MTKEQFQAFCSVANDINARLGLPTRDSEDETYINSHWDCFSRWGNCFVDGAEPAESITRKHLFEAMMSIAMWANLLSRFINVAWIPTQTMIWLIVFKKLSFYGYEQKYLYISIVCEWELMRIEMRKMKWTIEECKSLTDSVSEKS